MAIYNQCMNDGTVACSTDEKAQIKLAYTFASFFAGDTSAWQARADQTFMDGEAEKTSLNDSLPLVTGKAFDDQMAIWYSSPTHTRFKDAAVMPGWHEVLKIWKAGQFWAISDKATVWTYNYEGASRPILYEWLNAYQADIAGAVRTDANWPNEVKSRLADWNTQFNARYQESSKNLVKGLKDFYGFKDADFK